MTQQQITSPINSYLGISRFLSYKLSEIYCSTVVIKNLEYASNYSHSFWINFVVVFWVGLIFWHDEPVDYCWQIIKPIILSWENSENPIDPCIFEPLYCIWILLVSCHFGRTSFVIQLGTIFIYLGYFYIFHISSTVH